MTRAMSLAAGMGVSDAVPRVVAEVLLDRQPPFRLSGRNQPSCLIPAVRDTRRDRLNWVDGGPSFIALKSAAVGGEASFAQAA